jgi:hypothetical protein
MRQMGSSSVRAHRLEALRWVCTRQHGIKIAPLLSTAFPMKPLYACANGVERHSAT